MRKMMMKKYFNKLLARFALVFVIMGFFMYSKPCNAIEPYIENSSYDDIQSLTADEGRYGRYDPYIDEAMKWYDMLIKDKLDIGLRISSYKLSRTSEDPNLSREEQLANDGALNYFVGSIDSMNEDQNGFGKENLFISWFPLKYAGIDLTWDKVSGETWTTEKLNPDGSYLGGGYSDGTVIADGRVISFVVRYPNKTILTPYAGIGTVFYGTPDVSADWWHWGFGGDTWRDAEASYNNWRSSGSPGDPNGGYRRTFYPEQKNGKTWYIGLDVEFYKHWKLDIYYRSVDVVFDNTYRTSVHTTILKEVKSKWDLSHTLTGFGVKYSF